MDQLRRFGPPTIIVILVALFVVQNTEEARFDFLMVTFAAPLWLMLTLFFVVGMACAWWMGRRRRS